MVISTHAHDLIGPSSILCVGTILSNFISAMNDHSKYQNTVYFIFIIDKLKPGSHITVTVPAVPAAVSKAGYDYGTCVLSQLSKAEFNLVCGTAGTVQSWKNNLMSLVKSSSS